MKTAKEIESNINNINYYVGKIKESVKEQLDADFKLGDINVSAGSIRFDALGAIGSNCEQIHTYLQSIFNNLKTAVGQDKLLTKPEEEEGDKE
ncbi:hypothetical protein ES704_01965 [subsurface metagenome]|jgi:uncharacterized protein (UPF0264 family)